MRQPDRFDCRGQRFGQDDTAEGGGRCFASGPGRNHLSTQTNSDASCARSGPKGSCLCVRRNECISIHERHGEPGGWCLYCQREKGGPAFFGV